MPFIFLQYIFFYQLLEWFFNNSIYPPNLIKISHFFRTYFPFSLVGQMNTVSSIFNYIFEGTCTLTPPPPRSPQILDKLLFAAFSLLSILSSMAQQDFSIFSDPILLPNMGTITICYYHMIRNAYHIFVAIIEIAQEVSPLHIFLIIKSNIFREISLISKHKE